MNLSRFSTFYFKDERMNSTVTIPNRIIKHFNDLYDQCQTSQTDTLWQRFMKTATDIQYVARSSIYTEN